MSTITEKKSTAQLIFPQEYSGSNTLQQLDQGVYVNDINVMLGSSFIKIRPNNDFLKVKFGIRVGVDEGAFDDTESPSSLVLSGTSGSILIYQKSQIPLSLFPRGEPGEGTGAKLSGVAIAPSHKLLDYDFGQPDFFQDGSSFTDKSRSIDPLWIIDVNPADLPSLISKDMVNSSELISTDGVLDPFAVRQEADRSYTEIPFRFKGFRGDLVNDNVYRRSTLIVDEQPIVSTRRRSGPNGVPTTYSTDPFLDAGNEVGLDDLSTSQDIGPINTEGFVLVETSAQSPYVDSSDNVLICDDLELEESDPLRAVIMNMSGSGVFPAHDYLSRDHVSLAHGFVYDNNHIGIESIAFGGLLK